MSVDVVAHLAETWRVWQADESFPFAADHCVNGARVATRALAKLGVECRPVSVELRLFNRLGWQHATMRVPVDQWPPQAWGLGIDPDGRDNIARRAWNGHLMVEGDGWTLDVSAHQFHRPGRIDVPGPWLIPTTLPDVEPWMLTDNLGQVLIVRRWVQNNGWRYAPGWRRLHEAEVAALLERMQP